MKYNPNIKTTHYFVSDENMMLTQNAPWDINGDYGKGDAIGRTCEAYMCYKDPKMIEAIKKCWIKVEDKKYKDGYYYRPQRYPTPDYYDIDFSRDHTISTFTAMNYAGEEEWINEVGNHIRFIFRENINHKFTLGLWFWVKSLVGKWWAKPLFYIFTYIEVLLYVILNPICYLMGGIKKEMTVDEYINHDIKMIEENKKRLKRQYASKWKKFWISLHFPTFGIHKLSWQIMSMKKSIWKKGLEKLLLIIVPKHNYLLKLHLNSKKVKKEQVKSYKSTGGTRWTTTLNVCNDRDIRYKKGKDIEANVQDVDILIALWNEKIK